MGNIVQLLTCMKDQISSRCVDSDMMSTSMGHANNVDKERGTSGALFDDHNVTVKPAGESKDKKDVFAKPQVKAELIKRHLKSLRMCDSGNTIPTATVVSNVGSMTSVKSDDNVPLNFHSKHMQRSYSHSSSPSLRTESPAELEVKGGLTAPEVTECSVRCGRDQRRTMSVEQSSSKLQSHLSFTTNGCSRQRDIAGIDQMDVEFPLEAKTRKFTKLNTNDVVRNHQDSGAQTIPSQKHPMKSPPLKFRQTSLSSFSSKGL